MNRLFISLLLTFALVSSEYQLVWQDEFNGNQLDGSKWKIEQDCSGGGNNELQCYTNRASNIRVDNGLLYVTAKAENYNGKQYTSGRLNTKDSASWKYGRFDIRAKLPKGDYLWPALWMLPRDSVYGGWAASGEIDIMEARGQSPTITEATLHHGGSWPNNVYTGSGAVSFPFDFSADFHVFSCIWERDQIQFLVDGKVFSVQNLNRNWSSGKGQSPYNANRQPFDQPFFFIINLAIGGGFFGAQANALNQQIANNWPSSSLVVDYVRVYQDNGAVAVNPVPVPVQQTQVAKLPAATNVADTCNGKCGNGLSCCMDQKNGQICFDPNVYSCVADGLNNGQHSLCGKGLGSCSSTCFDTSAYVCSGGKVSQKSASNQNPAPAPNDKTNGAAVTPAKTTVAPTKASTCTLNCGSGSCCNDARAGQVCFDSKSYRCTSDLFNANQYLCPVGSSSCKGACFDSSKYVCTSGKINLL